MSKSTTDKKRWIISQTELESWLDGISNARTLIAPRQMGGIVLYRPVSKSDEIAWDGQPAQRSASSGRPVLSVKEIFFPPTECLFTIQKTGQEIHLEESFPDWETVVFGVRPCDAHGVKLLDALFLDTNPVDSFYARRRGNTTLIGLACQSLGSTCFCTSVGGAPDDAHDVDIMLFITEQGYIAEAVTEKGRFLIPGGEWKETTANPPSLNHSEQFPVPINAKWPEHFNDEYWMKISERCLSCRACAYVCPTCRCFAVRDEVVKPGEFERIRCWDACAGENYRRVAGGHKPRAEKSERLRNRFFCKFYYYPEQYGLGAASACTGCGRCLDVCPAGVDITEVLMDLEKTA
jgi:sulfhydrogenase subunit beta (sulfur reductase)